MKWKTKYVKTVACDTDAHNDIRIELTVFNEHFSDVHAHIHINLFYKDMEQGKVSNAAGLEMDLERQLKIFNDYINNGDNVKKYIKDQGFIRKR
jgi:hypothetical protein